MRFNAQCAISNKIIKSNLIFTFSIGNMLTFWYIISKELL